MLWTADVRVVRVGEADVVPTSPVDGVPGRAVVRPEAVITSLAMQHVPSALPVHDILPAASVHPVVSDARELFMVGGRPGEAYSPPIWTYDWRPVDRSDRPR